VPNTKSCKKRVKTNEIRRQRNMARRSRLRHSLRDSRNVVKAATEALGPEQLSHVGETTRLLDRMQSKGLIHANKAARIKSRLTRQAAAAGNK
jgi:small subunit ribosomal protein S20